MNRQKMPKRARPKGWGRNGRRKRQRRERRKTTRFQRLVIAGRGFPSKLKMVHTYIVTYPVTGSGGVMNYFSVKANGMYDPEPAVGGHQVSYFDQCAALYDHFTVIGSRARVTFSASATTVNPPFKCGVWVNDNTVLTNASIDGLIEQTGAKYLQLGPDNMQGTITKSFSLRRQFGKVNTSQDGYRGSDTSDPTELGYYTIALQSCDTATGAFDAYVTVYVSYIAIWSELKDVTQS